MAFTRPTAYAGVSLQVVNYDDVVLQNPRAFAETTSLTMYGEFYGFRN